MGPEGGSVLVRDLGEYATFYGWCCHCTVCTRCLSSMRLWHLSWVKYLPCRDRESYEPCSTHIPCRHVGGMEAMPMRLPAEDPIGQAIGQFQGRERESERWKVAATCESATVVRFPFPVKSVITELVGRTRGSSRTIQNQRKGPRQVYSRVPGPRASQHAYSAVKRMRRRRRRTGEGRPSWRGRRRHRRIPPSVWPWPAARRAVRLLAWLMRARHLPWYSGMGPLFPGHALAALPLPSPHGNHWPTTISLAYCRCSTLSMNEPMRATPPCTLSISNAVPRHL